ncbi:MAG: RICIN domain-containing protein [Anaerorhabdus sp.]
MKKYVAIVLMAVVLNLSLIPVKEVEAAQGSVMDKTGWTLIEEASDEFNGSDLNIAKWKRGIWYDVSSQLAFKDSNVTVSNGNLELHAKVENYNGKLYTIGSVESKFDVPGVNSYVEIRAKLLDSTANVLSAIWMQSSPLTSASNPNPEIDIHESFNFYQYEQALHTWKFKPDFHWKNGHHIWSTGVDMSKDYHIYGLERIDNKLKFYFDNQLAWETTVSEKSFAEMGRHMVLSLEGHLGTPNNTYLPEKFLVDYVRTYYRNDLINTPESGTYKIVNRKSGLALSVPESSMDNNAQLLQWAYEGHNNEKWILKKDADLSYTIQNVNSNKFIDVYEGKTGNGEKVIQFSYNGDNNQKWIIEPTGDKYYRILSLKTGKSLCVQDASLNNGAKIVQWSYGSAMNDQWQLIPQ